MAFVSRVEDIKYRHFHSEVMLVSASSPIQSSSTPRYRRCQSAASTFSWRSSTTCASSPESVEEDMELDSFDDSTSNLWSHSQRTTEIDAFNLDLTRNITDNTFPGSDHQDSLWTTKCKLLRSQSSNPIVRSQPSVTAEEGQNSKSSIFGQGDSNIDQSLNETETVKKAKKEGFFLRYRCLLFFVLSAVAAGVFVHCVLAPKETPCVELIDISLLNLSLVERVFGQHIAVEMVIKVLSEFNQDRNRQLLVMLWHGWTGVGKNFMSHIVSERLTEPAVHKMIIPLHFAHGTLREASDLRNWVMSNITSNSSCCLQLFIIDEVDKTSPQVIESLYETLVDLSNNRYGSRVIIILLSNDGAVNINLQLSNLLVQGLPREEVKPYDFAPIFHSTWLTKMVQDGLIEYVVPFLPLEKHHVIQCIEAELKVRHMKPSPELIDNILSQLSLFPSDLKFFVKTGCRKISFLVDFVL